MFEFVFTLILMVALSFALYLMVIALPRVAEDSATETKQGFLDRWAHSHIPEKLDATFNLFFLKLLRKAKVYMLKLDNSLGNRLKNMKLDDDAKKPIDFSDMTNNKGEEGK